jgi:hypothetical protein
LARLSTRLSRTRRHRRPGRAATCGSTGAHPDPKDAVEHKLNDAVCSGLVPLAKAQRAIAVRWVTASADTGLRVSGGKVCLRDNPSKCGDSRHGGSRDGD